MWFPRSVTPESTTKDVEPSALPHEEATQLLASVSSESYLKNVSATVTFPDGGSFTIFAEKAGFSTDIDGTVAAVGLSDAGNKNFNDNYVREIVAKNTKRFNDALVEEACDINNDRIVIIKGSSIEPADEADVYNLTLATLYRAIDEQAHLTAEFQPNASKIRELDLMMLYESTFIEPLSAVYDSETNSITEDVTGVSFNRIDAQIMMDQAAAGTKVVIPFVFTAPEVTTKQLEKMLFRDVLAERTTIISGTSNRLNNVELSAAAVDGTILAPGDIFSFNGIVGERTAERGYLEAGAYVNNETVQEIGGGICQTSSTIYDCVLHSDLEVIERLNHMFTVAYLPLGNDATINWGTVDLKFRNSTDYPIRIETEIDGRNLTVKLIGTRLDDDYIEIGFELISTTSFETVRQEDESVPQGSTITKSDGHVGYVVDTYKYLYDKDGNLISETLVGRSTYRAQNRVILIPPEPESADSDYEEDEAPADDLETPPSDFESSPPPEALPDGPAEDVTSEYLPIDEEYYSIGEADTQSNP